MKESAEGKEAPLLSLASPSPRDVYSYTTYVHMYLSILPF